jgi:tripartite-type tricarboxylate transporter receptor subunit TctC
MKLPRRRFLHLAAVAAALPAVSRVVWAQAYPTRPITMIVPFPAGGATDTLARFLSERLRASLRQPIIIENVAGAAGSIGVGRAARAAGDGDTLSIGTLTTHALIGGLYPLQFDLLTDFEPIAQLATEPLLISGKKSLPADNLMDLIAYLKANRCRVGQNRRRRRRGHLSGILFQRETGTRFHFVPYRGNGPATQDLVAGQIDLMIEPSSNFQSQVRAGTIKAFAVTSRTRFAAAPAIPTADEAGLPDFRSSLWYGLWAPKGAEAGHRQTPCRSHRCLPIRRCKIGSPISGSKSRRAISRRPKRSPLCNGPKSRWWPIIKAANIKGE